MYIITVGTTKHRITEETAKRLLPFMGVKAKVLGFHTFDNQYKYVMSDAVVSIEEDMELKK